ncbi:MAG: sulfite exporter TauE/SafE family protein, partial [Candidatus Acidiferrales bacterium]
IILGSWLTKITGARPLLIATGLLVFGFGVSFLLSPKEGKYAKGAPVGQEGDRPSNWRLRLVLISAGVGLISGLLANGGGFLLAPSYARFLGQPIKKAFACSLAVSVVLAIPGTVIHAYLGHVSWSITGLLATGSVPFSYLGAYIAIRTRASRLERIYGAALTILGIGFLFHM